MASNFDAKLLEKTKDTQKHTRAQTFFNTKAGFFSSRNQETQNDFFNSFVENKPKVNTEVNDNHNFFGLHKVYKFKTDYNTSRNNKVVKINTDKDFNRKTSSSTSYLSPSEQSETIFAKHFRRKQTMMQKSKVEISEASPMKNRIDTIEALPTEKKSM